MSKIAFLIARGGSKRIPKKNIKKFLGVPIIKRVVLVLKNSKIFDEIYISTDSKQIGEYVKKLGVKFKFLRPKKLADDFSDTLDVMNHAANFLKKNNYSDNLDVCCIYPTAVFTKVSDIKKSYLSFKKKNFEYLFCATKFDYPFQRGFYLKKNNRIKMLNAKFYKSRSQDLKDLYHDVGQFYWAKNKTWLKRKKIFGNKSGVYLIKNGKVVDIDTLSDWKNAEKIYKLYR